VFEKEWFRSIRQFTLVGTLRSFWITEMTAQDREYELNDRKLGWFFANPEAYYKLFPPAGAATTTAAVPADKIPSGVETAAQAYERRLQDLKEGRREREFDPHVKEAWQQMREEGERVREEREREQAQIDPRIHLKEWVDQQFGESKDIPEE
jgi:hypothetical protein